MATLFGDTSETLSDSQKGKHQVLIGTDEFDNLIFGDAGVSIIDSARGGNDTLTGAENASFGTGTINQLFGDTETMANFAKGGNDTLTGGAMRGMGDAIVDNQLFGDAAVMLNFAKGGQRHPDRRRQLRSRRPHRRS